MGLPKFLGYVPSSLLFINVSVNKIDRIHTKRTASDQTRLLTPMTPTERPPSFSESAKKQDDTQTKGGWIARMKDPQRVFSLCVCGSVSLVVLWDAKIGGQLTTAFHHMFTCSHQRDVTDVQSSLDAQNVDPRSDSAELLWRSVGLHSCAFIWLPFLPSLFPFFHCTFGQHLCSHSSSINSVCWGSSRPPPPLLFSSSTSSSPCFSTHACLSNRPHLGEIGLLQVCLQKVWPESRGDLILHPGSCLIRAHSLRVDPRRHLPLTKCMLTGRINECLSISGDLCSSWCLWFFGWSMISMIPLSCVLNSPVHFLVCSLETWRWPWIFGEEGMMRALCRKGSSELWTERGLNIISNFDLCPVVLWHYHFQTP